MVTTLLAAFAVGAWLGGGATWVTAGLIDGRRRNLWASLFGGVAYAVLQFGVSL
jgi:hypothetical protein